MKIEKRSTLTFNFNFIAIPDASKLPSTLNGSHEHCMLFLLTAITANMLRFGISFLISWYVSYLKECVWRFVYPPQTGQNHQLYEAATYVTTKKIETRGKRMEEQSEVCGYVIIVMEKRKLTCVENLVS
jgi:hypothetical protein